MSDLRDILSVPLAITLPGGRTVRSAPLDVDDWADLQAWLDAQQPDAFAAAHREIARRGHSVEIQKFLYAQALDLNSRRRVELGSPEAARVLGGSAGQAEIVRLSLRKGTRDITDAEIDAIVRSMDERIVSAIVIKADVPMAEPAPDPKTDGGPTMAP